MWAITFLDLAHEKYILIQTQNAIKSPGDSLCSGIIIKGMASGFLQVQSNFSVKATSHKTSIAFTL